MWIKPYIRTENRLWCNEIPKWPSHRKKKSRSAPLLHSSLQASSKRKGVKAPFPTWYHGKGHIDYKWPLIHPYLSLVHLSKSSSRIYYNCHWAGFLNPCQLSDWISRFSSNYLVLENKSIPSGGASCQAFLQKYGRQKARSISTVTVATYNKNK